MKRPGDPFKDTLVGLIGLVACLVLISLALQGCASRPEGIRLDKSPKDLAEEAACAPLPLCDIPPAANSTQLELALWACVQEYRALYSVCYHLVHPAPVLPPVTGGATEVCTQNSVPGAPSHCRPVPAVPAEVF